MYRGWMRIWFLYHMWYMISATSDMKNVEIFKKCWNLRKCWNFWMILKLILNFFWKKLKKCYFYTTVEIWYQPLARDMIFTQTWYNSMLYSRSCNNNEYIFLSGFLENPGKPWNFKIIFPLFPALKKTLQFLKNWVT